MSVNGQKYNRGAHGVSSSMLGTLVSSSENPPGFSRGECQMNSLLSKNDELHNRLAEALALTEAAMLAIVRRYGQADGDGWKLCISSADVADAVNALREYEVKVEIGVEARTIAVVRREA